MFTLFTPSIMSWNIIHYYSSLRLIGITDHDHFELLLLGFSKELLSLIRTNPSSSIEFGDLDLDLELPDEDLIPEINEAFKRYVKETSVDDSVFYLSLESEYDSENSCDAVVDFLCQKLFDYSCDLYFVLSTAAFDRGGGYSHQRVCYQLNNEFVVAPIHDFFDKFFSQPNHELNRVLSAIQAV
ncbi:hypothetical protein CB0101_08575 [Synechococcus sp. CB0101]|uniref:hypothetical protein n=1 Tax=Synechococcus sp. CB0101 TaxID=232348 RepID=UPI0010C48621|nr:hypothetical protein [Synechococcus sp. CB0101]QCH14974.1 hypothetical protein CB0101_08575 [Synechococcus sp. CB0101]